MRHPTRFWFPAAFLGVVAVFVCSSAAAPSSEGPRAAVISNGIEHTCLLTRTGAVRVLGLQRPRRARQWIHDLLQLVSNRRPGAE
jgi:hypothetical protein